MWHYHSYQCWCQASWDPCYLCSWFSAWSLCITLCSVVWVAFFVWPQNQSLPLSEAGFHFRRMDPSWSISTCAEFKNRKRLSFADDHLSDSPCAFQLSAVPATLWALSYPPSPLMWWHTAGLQWSCLHLLSPAAMCCFHPLFVCKTSWQYKCVCFMLTCGWTKSPEWCNFYIKGWPTHLLPDPLSHWQHSASQMGPNRKIQSK